MNYSPNMRIRNPVFSGERCFCFLARTDGINIFLRQSAIPMICAVVMAIFVCCVSIVFSLGRYAQMLWINAWRIIARVHNHHALRYFLSGKKFISVPMGANLFFSRQQKYAVSVFVSGSCPQPASVRFVNTPLKHILRAKQWIIVQISKCASLVVAFPAKFSTNGPVRTAPNATYISPKLVCHRASIKEPLIYALYMEVSN